MEPKILKDKNLRNFSVTAVLFLLFIALTIAVLTIDMQPIGPESSIVGLADLNKSLHDAIGVNHYWYNITEWTGLIAITVACGFSLLGLAQLIARKSIKKIDSDIFALGSFYLLVAICYALFEIWIVNYRPVMMDGTLEASFPSSHAMVVLCIMTTAIMQFQTRIKNRLLKTAVIYISALIIVMTIIGRLVSGVHWFTDIMGGVLLGFSLTMLYYSIVQRLNLSEHII